MEAEIGWKRAGRAVARRRRQVGYKNQEDAAKDAGIGIQTWREIEQGAGRARATSLSAVASFLRWPLDMIERIAEGEEPPAHLDEDRLTAVEDRLTAMDGRLTETGAAVDQIRALLADLLRRGAGR